MHVRPHIPCKRMTSLSIAAALMAFFASVGAGLDALVLPHQNTRLQRRLLAIWDRVDDVRFRDIATTMVGWYLRKESTIFGRFPSYRWIITALSLSFVVTTIALYLGRLAGIYLTVLCAGTLSAEGAPLEVLYRFGVASLNLFLGNVNHVKVYTLNLAFDAITMATTLVVLRLYLRQRLFVGRYFLILTDISACLIFFYVCSYLAFYADSTGSGVKYSVLEYHKFFSDVVSNPDCGYFHVFTSTFTFSLTVFLPTLVYLLGIYFFLNAKISLEACRWIVAHLLELSSTQQKTVIFYTGVFLGLVSAALKLSVDVATALIP